MSWLDKFQDGCTGISYLAGLIGHKIEVEGCCDTHDVQYVMGGSWVDKVRSDWQLAKCLYTGSARKRMGLLRAGGALLVTTFFPYAYSVWTKK